MGAREATAGRGLAFQLRGVSKRREKGGVAFDLVVPELEVAAGEFIAIVGPSGCGKSTLLDLLGLVLRPTAAHQFGVWDQNAARPGWRDVTTLSPRGLAAVRRASIGYVLQTGGLLPFLSVGENIALTRRLGGLPVAAEDILALAGRLGIVEQLGKKPAHLSGGQRQRAAIARALAHGPSIILADEPTAAVDRRAAVEIRDQFKSLAGKLGAAVLMVTHDRELVAPVADRAFTFELERPAAELTVATVVEGGLG
ncbi:ABC transporter related protein [Desulfarculus baarsii DSM 2075]|uniref:ABC transporter related protein n=1 Tax=Desulfarculus baarsii (strain ATCC 33931 / DSM 2075 / LMG 7858 / VKM B-1802 / 2st14) TaxID=644282 RepID=E1QGZ0_DESB2|nr:ATP-binding cassette domain-containing protein [Desulfarculus baarsii]ADK84833.1 ABC transporter related protein [Desulfarculus baarsii DSM 2075]